MVLWLPPQLWLFLQWAQSLFCVSKIPMKFKRSMLNWHFAGFKVSPHSLRCFMTACRRWLRVLWSGACTITSSEMFSTPSIPASAEVQNINMLSHVDIVHLWMILQKWDTCICILRCELQMLWSGEILVLALTDDNPISDPICWRSFIRSCFVEVHLL